MQSGQTPTERYLQKLGEKSFLSLWSWSNPYTDEGRRNGKGAGKELCDLLVMFGDVVILFSDKYVRFNEKIETRIAWQRWYRRAIKNSAKQLCGAESWLRRFPDRIYKDSDCSEKLPIQMPSLESVRFHRVSVAWGAYEACRDYFGGQGAGSLVIDSGIATDEAHVANPFHVGHVYPEKGFVHVYEDFTLDAVFQELDTISDFADYLARREEFLTRSKPIVVASGEEQLLSIYLTNLDSNGEHNFVLLGDSDGVDRVYVDETFWPRMVEDPQYKAKKEADRISFLWDELIERFIERGRPNNTEDFERGLRLMASEPRLRRRDLSDAFADLYSRGEDRARVMYSQSFSDRAYVFLMRQVPDGEEYDEYRERRNVLLRAYCAIARLNCHYANHVIGIASEPAGSYGASEDLFVLDVSDWTAQKRQDALWLQSQFGLLDPKRVVTLRGVTSEYPSTQGKWASTAAQSNQGRKDRAKRKRQEKKQSRRRNRRR